MTTHFHYGNLTSKDRVLQNAAYRFIMAATDEPVEWAYEVWDELVAGLADKDNHVRAIAAQVLCNLAKSDPEQRILHDFAMLLAVTKDERFVTARHCLQSLWKIGVVGAAQRSLLLAGLAFRFQECIVEKNCTLIRFDIAQGLRHLYDATGDAAVREQALALIATEEDTKYRKKYTAVWQNAS